MLSRITRSVAPTEAGERLLQTLGPMLQDLEATVASLQDLNERPSGTIRLPTVEHAGKTILMPAMKRLLTDAPDVRIEMTIDYGLADMVADRFDDGIRLGGEIAKEMIAVRIGPDVPMEIVEAPEFFRTHPARKAPVELVNHRGINLRLPTYGTLNRWQLVRDSRETRVSVDGPLALDNIDLIRDAALDGLRLAYLPLDQVQAAITARDLVRALARFTPDLPGYNLYYPQDGMPPRLLHC